MSKTAKLLEERAAEAVVCGVFEQIKGVRVYLNEFKTYFKLRIYLDEHANKITSAKFEQIKVALKPALDIPTYTGATWEVRPELVTRDTRPAAVVTFVLEFKWDKAETTKN